VIAGGLRDRDDGVTLVAVLGDDEVGDVGEPPAELSHVGVAQVLGYRVEVVHQGVHGPLPLRRHAQPARGPERHAPRARR